MTTMGRGCPEGRLQQRAACSRGPPAAEGRLQQRAACSRAQSRPLSALASYVVSPGSSPGVREPGPGQSCLAAPDAGRAGGRGALCAH
jgi:hypothetical protein